MPRPAPAIYLLIGFPGTGKYTVANALADRLEVAGRTTRIVDNHYVNNPIFGLVPNDGMTHLPDEIWDRIAEVRNAIIATIETLSPPSWSFIFTNHLIDVPDDRAWIERLRGVAVAKGLDFVPVRMLCDVDELCRRIVEPARSDRMKSISASQARSMYEEQEVFGAGAAGFTTLDITSTDPSDAAAAVVAAQLQRAPDQ